MGNLACFKFQLHDQTFKYRVHPNLNKTSHAHNILEFSDAHRAFSANTPLSLLKWQFKIADEDALPVAISCWPTPEAGGTHVAFELELTNKAIVLEDVCIRFQVPLAARPNVLKVDLGKADFDEVSSEVRWLIPRLDSGEVSGNLDFTVACDAASLTYIFEAARRGHTQCPMDILECYHQEKKDAIGFVVEKSSRYEFKCGI